MPLAVPFPLRLLLHFLRQSHPCLLGNALINLESLPLHSQLTRRYQTRATAAHRIANNATNGAEPLDEIFGFLDWLLPFMRALFPLRHRQEIRERSPPSFSRLADKRNNRLPLAPKLRSLHKAIANRQLNGERPEIIQMLAHRRHHFRQMRLTTVRQAKPAWTERACSKASQFAIEWDRFTVIRRITEDHIEAAISDGVAKFAEVTSFDSH